MIGLLYDEFNWEITEPEPESEEVILPSLFLEFEDEKTKTNNLLQIVSRQVSQDLTSWSFLSKLFIRLFKSSFFFYGVDSKARR